MRRPRRTKRALHTFQPPLNLPPGRVPSSSSRLGHILEQQRERESVLIRELGCPGILFGRDGEEMGERAGEVGRKGG